MTAKQTGSKAKKPTRKPAKRKPAKRKPAKRKPTTRKPAAPSKAGESDGSGGPRSRKGQRTRERLVEAAKEIFEEHGFLNARITDIAARANQSHGSFYYYFDSKEEIFREVVARLDERLFAPLDEVILAESGGAPQQRVREATRRYLETYRREARMMDLIEQVSRYDAEVNALRLEHHRRNTTRVADSIRRLQRRRLADPRLDPTVAATALGALTQRFAELRFVHGAVDGSLEHCVQQLSQLYENALQLTAPKKKR